MPPPMDAEAARGSPDFLAGGGRMGALMRRLDWHATPVGPPETWPQALKTSVRLMLTSQHPMFIWWGEALTCFYNDAYSALIGPDRHPSALGRPGREVWAEIWDVIGPQIDFVMAGHGATWHERQLIPITRGTALQDVWWTYGYSPIDDDGAATGVGGVLVICRDVTAEVRAEQARAQEAEQLRQFFEQAPGFMALLRGPAHVFELVNAAYLRLVGRDVVGKPVREAVPEVEGQGFFEKLDRVYATGEAFTAQRAPITFACGPDGALEQRFVDFVYQPVRDAGGAVTGIFVEGSDVTRAKLAEDELRANEARQALLLRLVRGQRETGDPEAMMRAAAEAVGRHLHANRVGFFEMRDADTLGLTVGWTDGGLDLLAGTFPAVGIGTAYLAAVRNGAVLGIADVMQDPLTSDSRFAGIGARAIIGVPIIHNGRWHAGMYVNHAAVRHWTEEEIALVRDVAGQTWDAVERARAVHALRELNATLEQRVEERTAERDRVWRNSRDLLLVVGADGIFRAVNPAWTAILGHDPAEVVGRSFLEFVWPDDAALTQNGLHSAVSTNNLTNFENRYRHKDGTPRWISWHTSVEGDLVYAYGRHITAEKEQEEALRRAEEELRQAQKMEAVGQLTGGIAHDFNNLLAGISGALELLQRRLEEGRIADLRRYADIAAVAATRAAALTQRLLAFARRQPLDPRPTDANRLLASMQELLRRTLGPGIELEMMLAGGLWPALCDPNQLENAVLNLAINGRDAMPEGGRLIVETANAHLDDAYARAEGGEVRPGQYVAVSVTDTGIGMPPEVVARVFEPFFTTKPTGQGTGLGLSMLYGFVKQSGGHVRVSSAPDRGTTMRLYLPRHRGGIAAEDDGAITALAEAGAGPTVGTVLLVEDEAAIRALAAEALAERGCRVLEAVDGPAGLRILEGGVRIDLLVTDVGLPGSLNGRQLADAARVRRPGLAVLFITGYAHNAALGNGAALAPGMEMMTKPFALDALATKVLGMIEKNPGDCR